MFDLRKRGSILLLLLLLVPAAGCRNPETAGSGSVTPSPTASASPETPSIPSTPSNPGGGTTPQPSTNPSPTGKLTAVRLATAQSGWVGGEGWIARTDDGGNHWQNQYIGNGTVSQLFALNDQDAWAVVGDNSNLLSTTDGGKHWTSAGQVPNKGFLHFVSQTEAFSANSTTTDGGKSWSKLNLPDGAEGDAYFHDKEHGWAVTEQKNTIHIERTTDGGKTWQTVLSREAVSTLNGSVIRSAGTDDAWVEWIGDSGMTQTSYSLFHTTNSGQTWQTVIANSTAGGGPAPGFPSDYKGPNNSGSKPGPLYVVDQKTAFMGGECPACDKPNTVGRTTDGGKTWTNGTASFAGYAGALLAIADASRGWWICTDNTEPSVLYTTSDGGAHWDKIYSFPRSKPAS